MLRRRVSVDTTSRRVRFSHYFTLLYGAIALFFGYNLRDAALFATTEFRNNEVGVIAYYPSNWLLDTSTAVMRVTDTSRSGFKTVIQIDVEPFGPRMSARNIIDALTLERQGTLPYYRNVTTTEMTLRTQDRAVISEYTFVYAPNDPFLEAIPETVIGRDVLIIRRNQAILITFQADESTYETDLEVFDAFLDSLDY